jgi:hypothetical protein
MDIFILLEKKLFYYSYLSIGLTKCSAMQDGKIMHTFFTFLWL